jgi:hypothetical protein
LRKNSFWKLQHVYLWYYFCGTCYSTRVLELGFCNKWIPSTSLRLIAWPDRPSFFAFTFRGQNIFNSMWLTMCDMFAFEAWACVEMCTFLTHLYYEKTKLQLWLWKLTTKAQLCDLIQQLLWQHIKGRSSFLEGQYYLNKSLVSSISVWHIHTYNNIFLKDQSGWLFKKL